MQSSIYYSEEDKYLIDKLKNKALSERRSTSACLLSILEEYFEGGNLLGEILTDMGRLEKEELKKSLRLQEEIDNDKKVGQILMENGYVREVDLERALDIQKQTDRNWNKSNQL